MKTSGSKSKFFLASAVTVLMGLSACQPQSDTSTDTQTSKPSNTADVTKVERNPTKNAYFGDTHVHTKNSFDAFIVGTRTNADDAYRFAKGEPIDNGEGHQIQIDGPPLDFYAVTDHGEYMGVIAAMRDKNSHISKTKTAKSIFGLFGGSREDRTNAFIRIGTTIVTGEPIEDIYDRDFIDNAWAENVSAAEKHNEPGKFTTFAGYEFTAMEILGNIDDNLGAINLHRNVIFEDVAPTRLFSTLDSPNPEDLWTWMNSERAAGRDVISIPHNSNGSNGAMFDLEMTDGSPLTAAYAKNRILNEPIVEMTQIKGTSETHPLLSPQDEFADFELYDILIGMPVKSKVTEGSFVRPSLARGMKLEAELGENPYKFGMIGASDTHVSAPSLSEENHFGKFANDMNADVRGSVPRGGAKTWPAANEDPGAPDAGDMQLIAAAQYGASGLAGVWAESNTREDIFNGMKNKETFATSGPRMRVRMFAGQDYAATILTQPNLTELAYAGGVPMGGDLTSDGSSPTFLAWATQDPNGKPLQRLQIIKVTPTGEALYDVACASGGAINPTTHRCADNGASVDLSTCATNDETGVAELKAVWEDPNYTSGEHAAYYVRVLENPKCRWSTWDAIRNGTPPNPQMHATLQDRAWTSPIWVK